MKLAILSDLHGNAVALSAVLSDAERCGIDGVVCLGDVATLGPEPNVVVETVRGLRCPCIMGNHDEFLIHPELINSYTDVQIIKDAVDWCRNELTPENLEFVKEFAPLLEVDLGHGRVMLAYHGDPKSHTGAITPGTNDSDLNRHMAGKSYAVMAGGHTHFSMIKRHRGTYFLNPGSLGEPFREIDPAGAPQLLGGAEYALVESTDQSIGVELRKVDLEKKTLLDSVKNSSNPLAGWFVDMYADM